MIQYRSICRQELDRALFAGFVRRQEVTRCWRKADGAWVIRDVPFVDDWNETDYAALVDCLRRTLAQGGFVYGAFQNGILKSFVSVEAGPLGSRGQYRDLSSLHVSQELRGQGIGAVLFLSAARWAAGQGGQKLYISAHSAVESQAFYRKMGCVEAEEYDPAHTAAEPCDCQLEYLLTDQPLNSHEKHCHHS